MKKMRICLVTGLLLALLVGCTGAGGASASGTLTVGVRDDIMDFGYLNQTAGKHYGLEIDLAQELADRLGYENVEYVSVTADSREEALLDGDVDCLIAAFSITDSRLEEFSFSEPYYVDGTSIMVENSTLINRMEDLADKTIGVLNGANSGALLGEKFSSEGMISGEILSDTDKETVYDHLRLLKYDSYEDLYWAMEEGEVDAACMDGCIAHSYLDDDSSLLDVSIAEQKYGVATQKDSELAGEVDSAMKEILSDGTMDEIINKWL